MNQSTEPNLTALGLIQAAETLQRTGAAASDVIALYETWIRHNSNAPLLYAVLFNYSVVLTESGDLQSARACLERAIVLNPEFAPPQSISGTYWSDLDSAI